MELSQMNAARRRSYALLGALALALLIGIGACRISLGPVPSLPHPSPEQAYLKTLTSIPPRNSGGLWLFYKDEFGPALPDRSEAEIDQMAERARKLKEAGSQYIGFWIPWSQVEPEPGRFEFGKFERLLSAVVLTGQKLEINLASSMYPAWFYESVLRPDSGRNMFWFWEDASRAPGAAPEVALGPNHGFHPRRVQSPPLSLWAPPEAKAFIKRFVDRAFSDLLDKWAPAVLYVQFSLGRLNEPNYPDHEHFWCYDPNAVRDFREKMEARYGSIERLNEAWQTGHADFSEIGPPVPPFRGVRPAQRADFFDWYRDSKRRWVNEATAWIKPHLKAWQRNLVYVAGGSGDIELAEQGPPYLEQGLRLDWTDPTYAPHVMDTIRAMEDNFWIVRRAKEEGWALQYAGVSGLTETEELAPCRRNPVCYEVPRYAASIGFTGPIYAQIPALRRDLRQPEFVAEQIYTYDAGYHGLHWTNDENLFGPQDGPRLESLARAWRNIQLYFGTDAQPPVILGIREQVAGSSVEVDWTTDEPSEGFVLYGPSPRRLDQLSAYDPLKTDHTVTLEGLGPEGTYYYLVFATDAFGNSTASPVRSFGLR
jgi:hypothetical protein